MADGDILVRTEDERLASPGTLVSEVGQARGPLFGLFTTWPSRVPKVACCASVARASTQRSLRLGGRQGLSAVRSPRTRGSLFLLLVVCATSAFATDSVSNLDLFPDRDEELRAEDANAVPDPEGSDGGGGLSNQPRPDRSTVSPPDPPADRPTPPSNDREYSLLERVPPIYPRSAERRDIEGYVVLQFTVTATGRARDIVVIEAVPRGVFNSASKAALEQWRFRPRTVDGKPVGVRGVRTRVVFQLPD